MLYLFYWFILLLESELCLMWNGKRGLLLLGFWKFSWFISIKVMFIGDICGDIMIEGYLSIFGMASFIV